MITSNCQQYLELRTLPCDWTEAITSQVYKNGNVQLASNYRPVSLTRVVSKIMEHIFCKHILNHLDNFGVLSSCQHGFRKAYSCETQLLLTLDDLMHSLNHNIQCDVAIMDFSRAFDDVPHERLLSKFEHYGIRGPIHTWIRSFLSIRQMLVANDVESSPKAQVESGVPQGTVLGPLLFLLFINDLPDIVSVGTTVRLFADDCLVYRDIKFVEDQEVLQRDLTVLDNCVRRWGMHFNPSKCNIMTVHRSRFPSRYTNFVMQPFRL